jgi:hypothetical protein
MWRARKRSFVSERNGVGSRLESIACFLICSRSSDICKVSNVGGGYNLDRRFPFGSGEESE